MSTAWLRASEALWKRRHTYRNARVQYWARKNDHGQLERWKDLRAEASLNLKRRRAQLAERDTAKPQIITAAQMGLKFANVFGALGPELHVTGHHTAGPTNHSVQHGISLFRSYHHAHAAKGWGGLGYHYAILRDGEILALRPTSQKGAHTGGANSSNVGVAFPGTTGDEPTAAQQASYRWLLSHAHTTRLPRAHRTDRDLRKAKRHGHNDWPGHASNACPGTHKKLIKELSR